MMFLYSLTIFNMLLTDLDYNAVLHRIKIGHAYNSGHQIGMVNELNDIIVQNNIKLVVFQVCRWIQREL